MGKAKVLQHLTLRRDLKYPTYVDEEKEEGRKEQASAISRMVDASGAKGKRKKVQNAKKKNQLKSKKLNLYM